MLEYIFQKLARHCVPNFKIVKFNHCSKELAIKLLTQVVIIFVLYYTLVNNINYYIRFNFKYR